jgi:hypothetical protein
MEVKPYLLEAPDRYGRFNELFELLGMEGLVLVLYLCEAVEIFVDVLTSKCT